MLTQFALLLSLLGPGWNVASTRPVDTDLRLAQSFELPGSEKKDPVPRAGTAKAKKKDKEIKTEADLWGGGDAAPDAKGAEPDVEEVDPDDVEDVDPTPAKPAADSNPDQIGGWGADAQRDSWGDEERLGDDKPLGTAAEPPDAARENKAPPEDKPAPAATKEPQGPADGGPSDAAASAPDGGEDVPPAALVDEGDRVPGVQTFNEDIAAPAGSMAELAQHWEQRRLHLAQRDFALAAKDLERFLGLFHELALGNLDLQANVFIREAERAHQRQDEKQAEALLQTALQVAPDLPRAHLAKAWYKFRTDPLAVGEVSGSLIDAASAAWRNPLARNNLLINLVLGLLLGLGLTVVVFGVLQLLRHLKLFLHDFHHLFPKGVAYLQTTILGLLIILLPVFFRAGLAVTILVWLLVAWIFQNWRERALTIVAFLFLAGAPLVLWAVAGWMQLPGSTAGDKIAVVRGAASGAEVRRLKAALAESPDDETLLGVLGDYHKRMGDYEQALSYYQRAQERAPSSAVVVNNLGNVYFLRNELKKAQAQYQRATQLAPGQVEPYFNLSRAFFRAADLDKGKESGNEAIGLDSSRARALREQANTGLANYVVADLPLPEAWLTRDGHRRDGPTGKTTQGLWRAVAGASSVEIYWVVSASAVVLFLLFLLLRRKVFSSNACIRCGRPACRRCSPELRDDTVCGQCFHVFVQKNQVEAKARIAKEIQIRQYRRRKESLARGLSFILPGSGQIIKGRTLRGALILFVFCLVLVQVLIGEPILRDASSFSPGRNWLLLIPLFVLFAAFYAWALLDIFRSD